MTTKTARPPLEESNLRIFFVNTGIRWCLVNSRTVIRWCLVNSRTVINVVVSIEFFPMFREVPKGMQYQGARQSSMHVC